MKTHSTNYFDTLVEIAEDCPEKAGIVPPMRGQKKSVANYQYEMLMDHPYIYTSDEVFFTIYALRKEIPSAEWEAARTEFFSKGQPCFRSSPLTKRYGWGIHSDDHGKVALFGAETAEYQQLLADEKIKKVKAMRSAGKCVVHYLTRHNNRKDKLTTSLPYIEEISPKI